MRISIEMDHYGLDVGLVCALRTAAQIESVVPLIASGADMKVKPGGNFVRIGKRSLEMNQYFETIVMVADRRGCRLVII